MEDMDEGGAARSSLSGSGPPLFCHSGSHPLSFLKVLTTDRRAALNDGEQCIRSAASKRAHSGRQRGSAGAVPVLPGSLAVSPEAGRAGQTRPTGDPRAQGSEAAGGAEHEALPQASHLAATAAAPPAGRRRPGPAGGQGQRSRAAADETSSSPGPRSAYRKATRRRHGCHFPWPSALRERGRG